VVSLTDNGQVAFVATTRSAPKAVYVQTPGVAMPYPVVNDDIKYADFGPPRADQRGPALLLGEDEEPDRGDPAHAR
jgi:hypothetical protein